MDREVRQTRTAANGKAQIDIAIPSFGYKNHIVIDQRFGSIRKAVVTHGASHDGSQLREVVTTNISASDVWADTALVDHQQRILGAERLNDIVAHNISQGVSIPRTPPKDRRPGRRASSQCLLCSSPSGQSRNSPADCATRFCVNSPSIRPFTWRSNDARSSSVAAIDLSAIHSLLAMETY